VLSVLELGRDVGMSELDSIIRQARYKSIIRKERDDGDNRMLGSAP
jgi:hypothetical protein